MNNITDPQRLAFIIRELGRLRPGSALSENQLSQQITLARSIIRLLDQTLLLERVARVDDQVLVVTRLQDLAYCHPDSGGIRDIAHWCVRQWLRLSQQHPEDVGVLGGLGQAWLFKSQMSLARIDVEERGPPTPKPHEESNAQKHGANYVEARGTLIPATEYLTRAVNLAERDGVLGGRLLSLAAEAYMSLGNVSYAPANERLYRQALSYLRRASQIPGYSLARHLQQYLNDNGSLFD